METWPTVALVLGSNIIIALVTFLTARYQVVHSDKRFSAELQISEQRNIEAQSKELRERRREVRSEPLLKLRDELAIMSTKGDRLAKRGNDFTVPDKTEEQINTALQEAIFDWNQYIKGDYLTKVLNTQADEELKQLIKEIRNKYVETYHYVVTYRDEIDQVELLKSQRAAEEKIAPMVTQAQELINKKLEEL